MRYSKKAFAEATQAAAKLSLAAEGAKTTWSTLAAKGIDQGHLTLAEVEKGLLAAYNAENKSEFKNIGQTGNSTLRGWIADFKRVVNAGAVNQLASGKPLTSVRREVAKNDNGTAKPKAAKTSAKQSVKLSDAIAAVRYYVQAAKGKQDLENSLAANGDLAAMVQDIRKMEQRVAKRIDEGLAKAA